MYPADIEAILAESPAIAEATVVAVPDEALGEVPVACVVLAPGRSITCAEVMTLFQGRLAEYKYPRGVAFFDALPRNVAGKVQKDELRSLIELGEPKPHR